MSGTTDNVIYFTTAGAAGVPPELWASNGTSSGTYVVQALPAGSTVYPLLEYDGVFIVLSTNLDETDFYATTGNAATTIDAFSVPVGPITLNQNGSAEPYAILPAATTGGLPFVVAGAALGPAAVVGKSDTTQSGTTLIDTITAPLGAAPDTLTDFVAVGDTAYFVDAPASGEVHLDSTQGTDVQSVLSAGTLAALTAITDPTLGTRLLFAATTGGATTLDVLAQGSDTPTVIDSLGSASVGTIVAAASVVFITETTASGSALLAGGTANATPTTVASFSGAAPTEVTAAADGSARVFFVQNGSLWVATATGATELATAFTSIGALFALGGVVYFAAATASSGSQLWSWNGTAAAATQLSSANSAAGGIDPGSFAALNGVLYFTANDGAGGTELWASGGTAASTQVVANLDPGGANETITAIVPGIAAPAPPAVPGNVAEYSGTLNGAGLTNGTAAGTTLGIAGVATITAGYQPDQVPALFVTHGTHTVTVTVGTTAGGYVYTAQGGNGVFYIVDDYDAAAPYTTGAGGPVSVGFIAQTSLTPQTLQTFSPINNGGSVAISQAVSGTLDYFVVVQSLPDDPTDAQLYVTNGTTVQEVGDLGAVQIAGINGVAVGNNWGDIVYTAAFNAELARSVNGGAPTVLTEASLGLVDNELDNATSIGVLGPLTFIATYADGNPEVIATDGTQAGTQVVATFTEAGALIHFINVGTLMLFTDPSGDLYASNGTAAGTSELLAGDALLVAPYGGSSTATTATITYDGVTYLYFAATVNGQTGLYRTDGHTVQTIQASGLPTNPAIVALNGQIVYLASATGEQGAVFTTLYATSPATTTGAPVADTSDYIAGSYLDPLLAPSATALQPVTLAPIGQSYTLTTGTDVINGGTADNTIVATSNTLNQTDTINAGTGGLNVLDLSGDGTFDLAAPVSLTGLSEVVAEGPDQAITLRPGTTLDVQLESTSVLGGTVQGANNADVITGGGEQSFYYVTVGGPDESVTEAGRVIEPTVDSAAAVSFTGVLELTGGGAATLGPNDNDDQQIVLDQPTQLTVEGSPSYAEALIVGSAGPDSVTLLTGPWVFEAEASGDTLTFRNGGSLYSGGSGELYGTAAHLTGDTINGYDFVDATGTTALIDISNLPYSSAETVTTSGDVLTATSGTISASITVTGLGAALQADPLGAFLTSADGSGGTLLTYQQQVFRLTTGTDIVNGTQDNTILATNDTLNNGDLINGGVGNVNVLDSILSLVGPGTFDLAAPTTLTGISSVVGDTTTGTAAVPQTIFLRSGTLDPNSTFQTVTLGVGADTVYGAVGDSSEIVNGYDVTRQGGDTITLGDARESVELQSSDTADVIYTDPATALASVSDAAYGVAPDETEIVTGTGIVGVGDAFLGTLSLAGGLQAYLLGDSPDAIVGGGDDLIDASFSSAGFSGGSVTVNPGGAGTVIASAVNSVVLQGSAAQLDGVTFAGFNFGPPNPDNGESNAIVVTDFTNAAALHDQLSGDVLTITDGVAQGVTIILPGAPSGTFTADTGTLGTTLTFVAASAITPEQATFNGSSFTGTGGNDTLTITPGQLAAGQNIDGGGGINTLILSGTGSFDLALPTTLVNFQAIDVAAGQTVTLRPGLTAEVDGNGATIVGAASADPIVLAGAGGSDDTVVLGSSQATVINADYGTTLVADAQTIGATIYGGKSTAILQVNGSGTAVMGGNIYDISTVDLGLSGLDFQANAIPGLAITVTGTAGTPDTIALGSGGDTVLDTSAGGNTFISNPADAVFEFGAPTYYQGFPTSDTIEDFDESGDDSILIPNGYNDYLFDQVSYSGDVLTISNGYSIGSEFYKSFAIHLPGSFVADDFVGQELVVGGQNLGFQVTYTGPVTCFRAGTLICTSRGAVAVEALAPGDQVRLSGGGTRPILWLGRRTIDIARHPRPATVCPVRIAKDAFGPNVPARDLFLSPDHAVLWDGVLIPVKHLINGVSIHPDQSARRVEYLHIELDAHDTILAEGMAVESYLETGQRHSFANGGAVSRLAADFAERAWEAHGCAPLAVVGPRVAAARAWLDRMARSMHAASTRRHPGQTGAPRAASAADGRLGSNQSASDTSTPQERLAKLAGGVAVIRVGGGSEPAAADVARRTSAGRARGRPPA